MPAQVRSGPRATKMGNQFVDKKVADLRRLLSAELDIPDGAIAKVSRDGGDTSTPVPENYVLEHGDLLEFVRPAGTKGVSIVLIAA